MNRRVKLSAAALRPLLAGVVRKSCASLRVGSAAPCIGASASRSRASGSVGDGTRSADCTVPMCSLIRASAAAVSPRSSAATMRTWSSQDYAASCEDW